MACMAFVVSLLSCNNSVSGISNDDFQMSLIEREKLNFINFQCVASADKYDEIIWELPSGEIVSGFSSVTAYFPYKGEYTVKVKVTKGLSSSEFSKTVFIRRDDPYVAKGEKLVWHDEFDDSALDPAFWKSRSTHYENNNWRSSDGKQNISLKDGILRIFACKEGEPQKVGQYTSVSLSTQKLKEFTYGRIEFRAKLPANMNIRPALSMLGNDIDESGWPACGEMSIANRLTLEPRAIYSGVHTYSNYEYTMHTDSMRVTDYDTEFHVYGIKWIPDKIDFYIDAPSNIYYSYSPSDINGRTWPFSKPFFVSLGLVMGGDRIGRQGVDNSSLPRDLFIDYIRVYQNL
ncbi:Glycosyl hydrolases family 16 [Dysgonomonas macrotermitis]|uniref:Glycosyl hydrolases family 16 n=2 Tax=Dysgonomonas macrotermitis TaxID=1346286 RepID=A0A1M5HK96_9BACT|nr:Glycosyl hydrolases family 16 [Dysgonomonas macrotermitis]